jgi:tight adherence protein B
MDDILDPQLIGIALAALAIAAVVFVLLQPYFDGERARQRMTSATESRSKKVATKVAADNAANRRKAVAETLKDIESRQKNEKISLAMKLQQAGLQITPQSFWIASVGLGLGLAAVVYILMWNNSMAQIAAMATAFIGVFGLPRFILKKMIVRRQNKFLTELANSLDVVVRGVKSGLPLNECLGILARESPEPLCSEFREVVEEQRVGVPLAEALDRMADRLPLPEVRFLTIVIGIQQQSGGNLSEALGNLSGVLRDRYRLAAKVKALSAEAKASAMILASLPPGVMGMMAMTAPDFAEPLYTTRTGTVFITLGLVWMGMGILVMKKMISFKY